MAMAKRVAAVLMEIIAKVFSCLGKKVEGNTSFYIEESICVKEDFLV